MTKRPYPATDFTSIIHVIMKANGLFNPICSTIPGTDQQLSNANKILALWTWNSRFGIQGRREILGLDLQVRYTNHSSSFDTTINYFTPYISLKIVHYSGIITEFSSEISSNYNKKA